MLFFPGYYFFPPAVPEKPSCFFLKVGGLHTVKVFSGHVARKLGLGKGRGLLRNAGFFADDHNAAIEAQLGQLGRGFAASLAGADDDKSLLDGGIVHKSVESSNGE